MHESLTRGVQRRVLPNGLTVLVSQASASPVVAIVTWVKAGYFHEPDEKAGMAHLFEHMFFKGSERFPGAERIGQEVSALGGVLNAGTIYDSTNYYFVLPREGFDRGVAIQADAVIRPLFDPEELVKEAEVVIEESNRKFDNPSAFATEKVYALAFTRHRMRRWRIGDNDVLRNIRRDDLLDFFGCMYRPENIIVSVVGDVEPEAAFATVEREYSSLPRGEVRLDHGPDEPPQDGFRFEQMSRDLAQSRVVIGWHTPGWGHPDIEALEILGGVLGAGKSCRLYRRAVGPDLAGGAFAYNYPVDDVGVFQVHAQFEASRLGRVEEALFREVEHVRRHPPAAHEVETARTQTLAGFLLGQEEVLGQAQILASREAKGDYRDIDRYLDRLRAVTPEDVRRVAAEYLRPSNASLFRYLEGSTAEAAPSRESVEATIQGVISDPGPEPPPDGPVERLLAGDLAGDLAGESADPRLVVRREILANGVTLILQEAHSVPTARFGVYFRGGRVEETAENAGITRLTLSAALRGAAGRTAVEQDRAIESLGSGFGAEFDAEYFGLGGPVPVDNLAPALGLLREVITEPEFPVDGVEKARGVQIAGIRAAGDSSTARPVDLFSRAMFGADHPFGLPQRGALEVVERLTPEDLAAWHRRTFDPGRMVLLVVGDVDPDRVRGFAEEHFGSLPAAADPVPEPPPVTALPGIVEEIEERPRRQSAFLMGFQAARAGHPDYFALEVMQHVVSGMAGRFFSELRGKQSLAYSIMAGDVARPRLGYFFGYLAGEHRKEERARKAMLVEFERLKEQPVSEEELSRAKGYIAGVTKIRHQTNGNRCVELARDELFGLGLDFTDRYLAEVATVSADDLLRVARTYFDSERYAIGVLRGRDGD